MPEQAPFDRIIATCSLPAVPWAWAEQVREGGLVLVDVKRSVHAGNLVLLTRHVDRLEGRFLSRWAGFMAIRDADEAPGNATAVDDVQAGTRSTTYLEPLPWSSLVPWFFAQARLTAYGLTTSTARIGGYSRTGREWSRHPASLARGCGR
jgi:hypothetical protein